MTPSAQLRRTPAADTQLAWPDRLRNWPAHRPLVAVIRDAPGPGWPRSCVADPIRRSDQPSLSIPTSSPPAGPASGRQTTTTQSSNQPVWLGALPYTLGPLADDAIAVNAGPSETPALWTAFESSQSNHGPSPSTGPTTGPSGGPSSVADYTLDPFDPSQTREAYLAGVRECIRLIRAGDAFQINLAHRLCTYFAGNARALFAELLERARPSFAAYIERPGLAILSLSPELFLEYDAPSRRVVTRPMKGTRPMGSGNPRELETSQKDRAELAMIVDLMRNDLGRVCELGSVRVERPRQIETHGDPINGVYQATAVVSGILREDRTPQDLLRAAFPPGSITGAPKIRATQIIRDLERATGLGPDAGGRGFYCGSIVLSRPDGSFTASVAIRTITIHGTSLDGLPGSFRDARLDLPVGAGIVADSDPEAEWRETLHKARSLIDLSIP